MDQVRPETAPAADSPALRLRRGIDATAAWQLVVLAVVWAGGALVVGGVARLLEPATGVGAPVVIGAWTLLGAAVFLPPVEHVLARVVLGLRRPTPDQLATFARAWATVCAQAGVRGDRYVLRVQRAGALNATAGAGHVVGVTATALALPARQLEAVLAHELGHHLGGHAMIGLLHAWYGWPLRLAARLVALVVRLGSVSLALMRMVSPLLALLALPLLLVSCLGQLLILAATLPVALPVMAATVVMRRSELRADGTAVRLGYGPELLALYRAWAAHEPPRPRGLRALRALVRDTHPRFETRVRAMEQALAGR